MNQPIMRVLVFQRTVLLCIIEASSACFDSSTKLVSIAVLNSLLSSVKL